MGEHVKYEPEFAWAVAWSNGSPRPFMMVFHVGARRRQAIESFLAGWQRDKAEPPMKAWRRAYREGARCIRVSVHAWGHPRQENGRG